MLNHSLHRWKRIWLNARMIYPDKQTNFMTQRAWMLMLFRMTRGSGLKLWPSTERFVFFVLLSAAPPQPAPLRFSCSLPHWGTGLLSPVHSALLRHAVGGHRWLKRWQVDSTLKLSIDPWELNQTANPPSLSARAASAAQREGKLGGLSARSTARRWMWISIRPAAAVEWSRAAIGLFYVPTETPTLNFGHFLPKIKIIGRFPSRNGSKKSSNSAWHCSLNTCSVW